MPLSPQETYSLFNILNNAAQKNSYGDYLRDFNKQMSDTIPAQLQYLLGMDSNALQRYLGDRGLNLQELLGNRGLDIQEGRNNQDYDLGGRSIDATNRQTDVTERLGEGRINLDQLLGMRGLDTQRDLGFGRLNADLGIAQGNQQTQRDVASIGAQSQNYGDMLDLQGVIEGANADRYASDNSLVGMLQRAMADERIAGTQAKSNVDVANISTQPELLAENNKSNRFGQVFPLVGNVLSGVMGKLFGIDLPQVNSAPTAAEPAPVAAAPQPAPELPFAPQNPSNQDIVRQMQDRKMLMGSTPLPSKQVPQMQEPDWMGRIPMGPKTPAPAQLPPPPNYGPISSILGGLGSLPQIPQPSQPPPYTPVLPPKPTQTAPPPSLDLPGTTEGGNFSASKPVGMTIEEWRRQMLAKQSGKTVAPDPTFNSGSPIRTAMPF